MGTLLHVTPFSRYFQRLLYELLSGEHSLHQVANRAARDGVVDRVSFCVIYPIEPGGRESAAVITRRVEEMQGLGLVQEEVVSSLIGRALILPIPPDGDISM